MRKKTILVLEIDQHSGTAENMTNFTLKTFKRSELRGGDSEAAMRIAGNCSRIIEVNKDADPPWGYMWFKPARNGRLKLWKRNLDSSG